MPWEPKYHLVSVEAFIDNLTVVFERDAADAIAFFQGDAELPTFEENIRTARTAAGPWPGLNLLPAAVDPAESGGGPLVESRAQIICEVETIGRVPDSLARYLIRYVMAVKSILYEMSKPDLVGEIPKTSVFVKDRLIGSERYAERLYESERLYTQVGSVVLTILYDQGLRNA